MFWDGRKKKGRGGGLQDCCRVHVRLPVRGLSLVTSVRKMSRLSRHLLLWVVGVADGELVIALTVSSLLSPPPPHPSSPCQFHPSCNVSPLNVFFRWSKKLVFAATTAGSALGSLGASALG